MSLRSRLRQMRLAQLDLVRVATPCGVSWDGMSGDDKVRFCAHCQLNVYNLSAMDVEEAAERIGQDEGRLCVRYYRRADGTLLTRDCPVGIERKHHGRRRALGHAVAGLAGAGLVSSCLLFPVQGAYARPAAQKAALFSAAKSGNTKYLSDCLDAGFDVDWSTASGITPLMFASIQGRVEAVRLLLLRGAHVNTRDAQGRTALTDARTGLAEAPAPERQSYRKVIRLLKDAGAME